MYQSTLPKQYCNESRLNPLDQLRWTSWRGDHFHIEGTAWRGMLRPGKAKTKGSKAPVTIPDVFLPILQTWREQNAGASKSCWHIAARELSGITPHLCHQCPETRDVQAHLRHSDIGTTLNEYTQTIPESVRKLVNAVADDVMTADIAHSLMVTGRIQ